MSSEVTFSAFSTSILNQKYAHTLKSGRQETWPEIAKRVATSVMSAVDAPKELTDDIEKAIAELKFIPGGRYLYACGRALKQTQNCFGGETMVVTREGTKAIKDMVGKNHTIMTSNGLWVDAPVMSFGKQQLMKVTITNSGATKEIYATPEHSWRIYENPSSSNKKHATTSQLKKGDSLCVVNPNARKENGWKVISVEETDRNEEVYCAVVEDTHEFVLEDNILTGNCLLLKADDSREGWSDLMHKSTMSLMTGAGIGVVYSDVRPEGSKINRTGGLATGPIALMQMVNEAGRFIMQGGSRRSAIWAGLHWNHPDSVKFVTIKNWRDEVKELKTKDYNFPATLDGTNISSILDDAFFKAYGDKDSKHHALAHNVYWSVIRQMLSTGEPGFSVDCGVNKKENLRNAPVCGDTIVITPDGGVRVIDIVGKPTDIWTGKQYAKNVVFKETSPASKVVKVRYGYSAYVRCSPDHPFLVNNPANDPGMNGEPIRVPAGELKPEHVLWASPTSLKGEGFYLYNVVSVEEEDNTEAVYCADVGVPEHSFQANGVIVSNCTEITSHDDSDICNLGSINMSRIDSLEEFKHVMRIGTAFLLAGTRYSDVPYQKVDEVRRKNRRLGLGLMGIHEWLLTHGKRYAPDPELQKYLEVYATSTEVAAEFADAWGISHPVKTRAIAPNGTIGIVAGTTTGIEPIFCVAYKRRYLKGSVVHYQYVVDPTAKRLIDSGVDPDSIEDAYSLAEDTERRVAFQAWMQKYVDHGISSTLNLPSWGSEHNNESKVQQFGDMLIKYLPDLRGITVYPDGSRGGQPLTPVKYSTAMKHVGQVFEEQADICDITKGGSCGS